MHACRYLSLVLVLIGSIIQSSLAISLITQAQERYQAPPEKDSLEAPLLGGTQAAANGMNGIHGEGSQGAKGKAAGKGKEGVKEKKEEEKVRR